MSDSPAPLSFGTEHSFLLKKFSRPDNHTLLLPFIIQKGMVNLEAKNLLDFFKRQAKRAAAIRLSDASTEDHIDSSVHALFPFTMRTERPAFRQPEYEATNSRFKNTNRQIFS